MSRSERWLRLAGIWLTVYPSVALMSYLLEWLDVDWPLWAEILLTTAITVPLISWVSVPLIERILARRRNESRAELKRDEARDIRD
ncbi:hypothetical protein [Wenxinia saemankumensis]|uniref:Uncharacterized protein n=1 Tax=Wenxinia saemankumensis TaxID=1447782 RepID=A0A1M6HE90_9RHOB|nr:hypothetical protein [Wenxinia saemankumensis]SHJ20456.1 hypothetical protein SAMN05444417_3184 [Wenxinia saemankumensis]